MMLFINIKMGFYLCSEFIFVELLRYKEYEKVINISHLWSIFIIHKHCNYAKSE